MGLRRRIHREIIFAVALTFPFATRAQQPSPPVSSSAKPVRKPLATGDSTLDPGAVANGVYRNKTLGLSCKIPPGWVLRTDEMNAHNEPEKPESRKDESGKDENARDRGTSPPSPSQTSNAAAKVLLAAFSRPPEARAEDVNSSILIAAESVTSYPGLKDAAQYFGPLTEVARAQGFAIDEEPYDFAVGTKTVVRGDFHKDVGSRVMRQSTIAVLSHGFAVSITVIAGTEDGVEELIDGLTITAPAK